jgi:hypothetical protein
MKKKTKKELIIGGVVLAAAGIGYYLYSREASATASTAAAASTPTPSASTPIASVPASTTVNTPVASTPTVNDDPTQPGAMIFTIESVVSDNQAGKYNVQFYMSITNNTGIPQTLQSVTGTARFNSIAAAYMSTPQPSPYTGNLGNVTDGTTVTIPAGQTVGKYYSVSVPVNSATNFYVAQLSYLNADPSTPRNLPFVFNGIAEVSNDSIPLSLTYLL